MTMTWVSAGILVAQIIIAIVSYLTIHRHRSIYGIKTKVFRMPNGTSADDGVLKTEAIDKELADGKYTILQFVTRNADKDFQVIMGRIKK